MKQQRTVARCPCFTSRVDYLGAYLISCMDVNLRFASREARDKAYTAACCADPTQCPRESVSRKQMQEARKNKRGGKITLNID